MAALEKARALCRSLTLTPNEAERHGIHINRDGVRRSAFDLLSYPDIDMAVLQRVWPELREVDRFASEQVEVEARYAAYLERQNDEIGYLNRDDAISIPELDYGGMAGLSNELREKLSLVRPATLGQASRIEGMTPAALTLLLAEAKRRGRRAA
jgi:tRNA uridine 5-carboxymethylaminomethyl modification enzyme